MASGHKKPTIVQGSAFHWFRWIHRIPSGVLLPFLALILLNAAEVPAQESAPVQSLPLATFEHMAMGTQFACTLVAPKPEMQTEELQYFADQSFAVIDTLEKRISTWKPDTEASRVNAKAADEPVEVSAKFLELLLESKRAYEETDGAFDVTVGPLLELWGFYKRDGHLPTDEELKEALDKVGMDKVIIDEQASTVRFLKPGMRLDFGGIGKGMALERMANVLRDSGITAAVLHSGTSTVEAIGTPPGQSGWTVRIRNPYNNEGEHIAEVQISNESLSTSSSSENFLELSGKKYGHIFDPRTGWPVSGMLSATVIGPGGLKTDALSTAFFVLGEERVRAYCAAHPAYRAILLVSDNGAPRLVRINFPSE